MSKRLFNAIFRDLKCFDEFQDHFGEFTDFQHPELQALAVLQNLRTWAKLVTSSLMSSYPRSVMVMLFMEGCKLLATCLHVMSECVIA